LGRLRSIEAAQPPSRPEAEAARRAITEAEALLLDWDGCVAFDDRLEPAALRLLAQNLPRVAIVSNNTTHLPEHFSEVLAAEGLSVPPSRVVLAGHETLRRAAEMGSARTLLLAGARMKLKARRLGLNLVREAADLVVLLRDNRFSYGKLERAANSLRAGARLLVGNPDLTHPGAQGRVVPETGSLLAALLACVEPDAVAIEVVGKPQPTLFELACRQLDVEPRRVVMIGDNPATDIAGAEALGMHGLLVGPRSGLSLHELAAPPA
jgi:4-nitrophenyl phosphatase